MIHQVLKEEKKSARVGDSAWQRAAPRPLARRALKSALTLYDSAQPRSAPRSSVALRQDALTLSALVTYANVAATLLRSVLRPQHAISQVAHWRYEAAVLPCYPGRRRQNWTLQGVDAAPSRVTDAARQVSSPSTPSLSTMAEHFEAAAEAAKAISDLSDANKLKIYGMYKQATLGDNTTDKPGMFNMVGKAKWYVSAVSRGRFCCRLRRPRRGCRCCWPSPVPPLLLSSPSPPATRGRCCCRCRRRCRRSKPPHAAAPPAHPLGPSQAGVGRQQGRRRRQGRIRGARQGAQARLQPGRIDARRAAIFGRR